MTLSMGGINVCTKSCGSISELPYFFCVLTYAIIDLDTSDLFSVLPS